MARNKSDFVKLYEENASLLEYQKKLLGENSDLRSVIDEINEHNSDLKKILSSKRYRLVDFFINNSYKLLRKKSKKQKLLERQKVKVRPRQTDVVAKKIESRSVKKGKVDIINYNFYDWDGKVLYKGGAERYVYDLACLLKGKGYKVRILQCSNIPFQKKYRGIEIVGVGKGVKWDARINSKMFNYYCQDCEFVIASPFKLACEIENIPVIGINHGVDFDAYWNRCYFDYTDRIKEVADSLRRVRKCVCVDTNFINWTRTIDYPLSMKEVYIPNYYDDKMMGMKIDEKEKKKFGNKIVFVYPRRIYEARGSDITLRALKRVLPKYKDRIIVKFVGQIDNEKAGECLKELMNNYPENVFHFTYDMSEMKNAYLDADVALIPTRYCEGTSLSCIEAMSMSCAVIATTVGGLPDLVIDGYNGILISPTTNDLEKAITSFIENPSLIKTMARNGYSIANKSLKKDIWDEKWLDVVDSLSNELRTGL